MEALTTSFDLANLDRTDQFHIWFDALFGCHDWPSGAKVILSTARPERSGLTVEHFAADDPEAIWKRIDSRASAGANVYIDLQLSPSSTPPGARGRKTDKLAITCFAVDLDTLDGVHKAASPPNPTREIALQMIDACPLMPSLVVDSSGGYYVFYLVDEPVDHVNGRMPPEMMRMKGWWTEEGRRRKVNVDAGPLGNVAGMLRPPGSLNHKQPLDWDGGARVLAGRPVVLVSHDPSARYSVNDFAEALEEVEVPTQSASTSRSHRPPTSTAGKHDRASDALIAAVDPGDVVQALGWDVVGDYGDHTDYLSSTAGVATGKSATVYRSGDGSATLTIFDAVDQAAAGLDGQDHQLTSWATWLRVGCGSDSRLAGLTVDAWRTSDGWDSEGFNAALVTAAAVAPPGTPVGQAMVLPDLARLDELTTTDDADGASGILDAITGTGTPQQVHLPTSDYYVEVGGYRTGLYRRGKGDAPDVRITDWVAVRTSAHRSIVAGVEDGMTYAVTILANSGQTWVLPEVAAKESLDPAYLRAESGAPIALPTALHDRAMLANVLAVVGSHEVQPTLIYRSLGWAEIGDRHHYLGTCNSIAANGPSPRTAALPAGSTGTVGGVIGNIGWPEEVADEDEIPDIITSVTDAMIGIAPGRPELGVACIGARYGAVARQSTRGSIVAIAPPGSDKSRAMQAPQSFFVHPSVSMDKRSYPLSLTADNTYKGAERVMAYMVDYPVLVDDAKVVEDRHQTDLIRRITSTLATSAYGSSAGVKSNVAGGLALGATAGCVGVVTGELQVLSGSARERVLALDLMPDDIDRSTGGGLDKYRELVARDLPRQMDAWVLAQVAGRLDRADWPGISGLEGTEAMSRWADRRAAHWYDRLGGDRPAELAAVFAVGWDLVRLFADEAGWEDALPSPQVVEAALVSLVRQQRSDLGRNSVPAQLMQAIGDALFAGTGYLADDLGNAPNGHIAGHLGWRTNEIGPGWIHSPTAAPLGRIGSIRVGMTADEAADHPIMLLPDGVRVIRERQRGFLASLGRGQTEEAIVEVAHPYSLTRSGRLAERPTAKPLDEFPALANTRSRAWFVPASALALESVVLAESQRLAKTARKAKENN